MRKGHRKPHDCGFFCMRILPAVAARIKKRLSRQTARAASQAIRPPKARRAKDVLNLSKTADPNLNNPADALQQSRLTHIFRQNFRAYARSNAHRTPNFSRFNPARKNFSKKMECVCAMPSIGKIRTDDAILKKQKTRLRHARRLALRAAAHTCDGAMRSIQFFRFLIFFAF